MWSQQVTKEKGLWEVFQHVQHQGAGSSLSEALATLGTVPL